jgi:hypothetical protein
MEEITIVKKRSRLGPILLVILLLVAIVIAALWLLGGQAAAAEISWYDGIDTARRNVSGTT